MKIMFLCLSALSLLLAGCATPPARGGSSGEDMEAATAPMTGHGESQPEDYRDILSDPGPF